MKMNPRFSGILVSVLRGCSILAFSLGILVIGMSLSRWLTLREFQMASEIEADKKIVVLMMQGIVGFVIGGILFAAASYLKGRTVLSPK